MHKPDAHEKNKDYIYQIRKPQERQGFADAGPETKGGEYHGAPKRWTGRGPVPARHIPWPEVSTDSNSCSYISDRLLLAIQASHLCRRRPPEDDRHGPQTHGRRHQELGTDMYLYRTRQDYAGGYKECLENICMGLLPKMAPYTD